MEEIGCPEPQREGRKSSEMGRVLFINPLAKGWLELPHASPLSMEGDAV